MGLTNKAIETLIDLVEIKVSCLEVIDREDARELANLQQCLDELNSFSKNAAILSNEVVAIGRKRGPGRPRRAA